MPEPKPYRLPLTVTPERYEIRLTPDMASATFDGEERVAIQVNEPVREIRLNAAELVIQDVSIKAKSGKTIRGDAILDPENEQAALQFTETVGPGPWELQIKFSGILNDKLHGFYRSTYKNATGEEKTLATTQFESTDARRAFPCWDEPVLKAIFQITLVVDERLTAISNARVIRVTPLPGAGKKEVVFADSMKMSTYLVAFIVGEFEASDPVMVGKAPLRVWAVPGKKPLANFGREIGRVSLEYFSRYYGISYPGDKLDLIAIPDFASGAMENLGAITFRETALLVDETKATRSELERVADVVSHENAHMWFGDLVTMRWWNGLWLNEAFATFMEMLAVDAWKPEWRRWDSFTVSRAAAMQVDGLKSTRPIEFPVEKPEEAAGMFDVLTYEKGASVLRMLEQYLGAEAFRNGIRLYLSRHAYGNAETTDLWDALEESTGQPVRALMDTWIFQAGFPVVTVEREGSELVLRQQIFRYLQDSDMPERAWHVPIFLRWKTATAVENRTVLLAAATMRIELPDAAETVVVNAGGHGYYRVRYSSELLRLLKQHLQTMLSPVERFNLVNDTWASTLAGLTSLTDYLELVDLLRDEQDLNVWTSVLISCHQLNRILDAAQRASLQDRIRAIISPAVERLTWSPRGGETELEGQLRGDLIGALGTVGEDGVCQERARVLFAQYEKDARAVDRNLIPALAAIVSHTGGGSDYENFVRRFKSAATPQEETRYLFALANFRREDLVDRTLQLTINGEVRTQNAPYLMRGLLLNQDARDKAWVFLKAHWDEMLRLYPDNSIPRMCEGIIGLATAEVAGDVEKFFNQHPVKQGAKQMEQHLERLRIAVACNERWKDLLRA
ncbi:MAG: M1 family metallopeptidase [Deltaproteobacteria bacterium]|nr:M1 family metallopeptidase [Deltaproteobacteria bacterium]MDZ4344891.1 M1 family metallopeptidase [Candidatus Binatia bacterium]